MNHINYPVPLTQSLQKQRQEWEDQAILTRTRFVTGTDVGLSGYGIADSRDPATASEGSGRPLTVTASDTSISVTITGGKVVFGNGEVLELETISTITVPTVYAGERHVLYLQWGQEGHDSVPNDMDTPVFLWTGEFDDQINYVRIARKVDYDQLPLDTRTQEIVPLALLTPTSTAVVVDMTRTEMSTCRPWATPIDIQHRSVIGSGTVTSRNAHGLAIQDLSVNSGQTLYDFMLPYGTIVARDVGIAGVPGRICEDVIPANGVLQDATGQITGYSGAYYVALARFPTQILQCVDTDTGLIEIAMVQIPNQNICFFLPYDEWTLTMGITVTYTAVDAAAPPVGTNLTLFTPSQPADNETIVADGVVVSAINGALSYATAGAYPFLSHVYVDSNGEIHRIPDTLKCDIQLTAAPGLQQVEIQPKIPCNIRIGMRGAVAGPLLDVRIAVSGIDSSSGASVTETLIFGASWTDSTIPSLTENPTQWVTSATVFESITSYQVTTRLNDGPNSAITIQGMYDANDISLANMLPVSDVFWDGLRMATITDTRPVRVAATEVEGLGTAAATLPFAETTQLLITAPAKAVMGAWYDDFDYPKWVGFNGTSASRWATGLGAGDVYRSRAIAVRPSASDGVALRVSPIPIEPGKGYSGSIRVYTLPAATWSAWIPVSSLVAPRFTYTIPAGEQVIKWQFEMTGPCKGLMATYIAESDAIPPSLIFDSGAFGVDSFG